MNPKALFWPRTKRSDMQKCFILSNSYRLDKQWACGILRSRSSTKKLENRLQQLKTPGLKLHLCSHSCSRTLPEILHFFCLSAFRKRFCKCQKGRGGDKKYYLSKRAIKWEKHTKLGLEMRRLKGYRRGTWAQSANIWRMWKPEKRKCGIIHEGLIRSNWRNLRKENILSVSRQT